MINEAPNYAFVLLFGVESMFFNVINIIDIADFEIDNQEKFLYRLINRPSPNDFIFHGV